MQPLTEHRCKLDKLLTQHRLAVAKVKDERKTLAQAEQDYAEAVEAQKLLQEVAQQVQQQAHSQIAAVVTKCLRTVFGEDAYEFRILFEQKRGKTEARLVFLREGQEVDPLDAAGGGIIDVAGFALRLASLVLARPVRRRLLVLDEPMKHLSANYRPRMRELLEILAGELGIQFVLVTHDQEFQVGTVIEI